MTSSLYPGVDVPIPTLPKVSITTTLALPAVANKILPFAAGILMLLLPFARVPIKLPAVTLPVTLKLDNVPTDVMFGCAAVVSVPVI